MTKASTARRSKRVAKKVAKKANGTSANGVVVLAEHEAEQFRKEQFAINNLKMELANVRLKREACEKREKELCRMIAANNEQLTAGVKEAAEGHGIDIEKDRWTLQVDQGRLVKNTA